LQIEMMVRKPYAAAGISLIALGVILAFATPRHLQQAGLARTELSGSAYVSDSGNSRDNFTFFSVYQLELVLRGDEGVLALNFVNGTRDVISEKAFRVSSFQVGERYMEFRIRREHVRLDFVENDSIWNHRYDGQYIASISTDKDERKGRIYPWIFPGVKPGWYLEVRIKPVGKGKR